MTAVGASQHPARSASAAARTALPALTAFSDERNVLQLVRRSPHWRHFACRGIPPAEALFSGRCGILWQAQHSSAHAAFFGTAAAYNLLPGRACVLSTITYEKEPSMRYIQGMEIDGIRLQSPEESDAEALIALMKQVLDETPYSG